MRTILSPACFTNSGTEYTCEGMGIGIRVGVGAAIELGVDVGARVGLGVATGVNADLGVEIVGVVAYVLF